MSNDLTAFSVEMPLNDPEAMKQFNDAMDDLYMATLDYIRELAKDLDITETCAFDVYYLRGRSRWSEELEAELIGLHKDHNPPNMCEFGH